MSLIDDILKERNKTHGDFDKQSELVQALEHAIRLSKNWDILPAHQKEALEMIMRKVSRILVGEPAHIDSWADIVGFAQLVINQLKKD